MAEVAARLGTTTHSLYAWIKRYDPQQPKITESAVLSIIRTWFPSLVNQRASTRPVGPAPLMSTSHMTYPFLY